MLRTHLAGADVLLHPTGALYLSAESALLVADIHFGKAVSFRKLGVPVPPDVPFESANMTPMARSFYSDNKRVSNKAIKDALGIELLHPTYREGLDSIAVTA